MGEITPDNPFKSDSRYWWTFSARIMELYNEHGIRDFNTPEVQDYLFSPPLKRPQPTLAKPLPPACTDGCSVYRAYDDQGRLLYVGITGKRLRRAQEHFTESDWWPLMVRQEWEHFDTRREALERELELIRDLGPLFNIAGRRTA